MSLNCHNAALASGGHDAGTLELRGIVMPQTRKAEKQGTMRRYAGSFGSCFFLPIFAIFNNSAYN